MPSKVLMMDKKILVVDDDDDMREALRMTLARLSPNVDVASDGQSGYEKAISTEYDLIISDIRMPVVDGVTMLKMLRSAGINTPITFITAHGTVENAVNALKLGAFDYILKPFSAEVIEEFVKRVFDLRDMKISQGKNKEAVFKSSYMAKMFLIAKDVSTSDVTVLITGASGTGKEVMARFIHENSKKRNGPFVAINCAAIPDALIESELFGYEKGAFTGADSKKIGKFESAAAGTLLLDEIGEMPLHLQSKLLRVLENKEIEKLGSTKTVKLDIRIVATTNRDLKKDVENGKFREDLYYRLNVINIEIPSLKQRKEDIGVLSDFFVKRYSNMNSKFIKKLSDEAIYALNNYDWPGNIRELEHTIERAVILSKGEYITKRDLFLHGIAFDDIRYLEKSEKGDHHDTLTSVQTIYKGKFIGKTIAEVEKDLILNTLSDNGGNRTKASKVLGITVRTLRNKLKEYREAGVDVNSYLN